MAASAAQQKNTDPKESALADSFFVTYGGESVYTDGRSVMRYVLPRSGNRFGTDLFGRRHAGRQPDPLVPFCVAAVSRADRGRCGLVSILTGGGAVKVVVWKSPKYLRGILCKLFHVT